jgi:phage baseplate assembly protein W
MAVVKKNKLFIGYSTVVTNSKVQQFADIELIKRDILNHFYTRKGERVMMPTWGCGIWNLLFEPFDAVTKDAIIYECQQVIESDSRVRWQTINAIEFEYGFQVQMDLLYVPYDVVDTFSLEFDRRTLSM